MPHFVWAAAAREALRGIDRSQAREILVALTQYANSAHGNVSPMKGKPTGRLRLRIGDYRVIFRQRGAETYEILRVGHRRDVYR